jgi:hypothetical protein
MVADTGTGLIRIATLVLVAGLTIAWCIPWCMERWSGGELRFAPAALYAYIAVTVLIMIAPPMRRCGKWIDADSGAPVSRSDAAEMDRDWYGYWPAWKWIWRVGRAEPEEVSLTIQINSRPRCSLAAYHWELNWFAILVQGALVFLWFLPFMFTRAMNQSDYANTKLGL